MKKKVGASRRHLIALTLHWIQIRSTASAWEPEELAVHRPPRALLELRANLLAGRFK